jgi:hypothetical protein
MSQKPNPVPPEEKRKRKKKTEHTLTRAVQQAAGIAKSWRTNRATAY